MCLNAITNQDKAFRRQSFSSISFSSTLFFSISSHLQLNSYNVCTLNNFCHICLKEAVKYLTEQSC